MENSFNPEQIERELYARWEASGSLRQQATAVLIAFSFRHLMSPAPCIWVTPLIRPLWIL